MARFLVERYWPGVNESAAAAALERLETTAAAIAAEGTAVRCVHTTFVPDEESLLWVFEAASAADIQRCAAEAQVPIDRITESIELVHREPAPTSRPSRNSAEWLESIEDRLTGYDGRPEEEEEEEEQLSKALIFVLAGMRADPLAGTRRDPALALRPARVAVGAQPLGSVCPIQPQPELLSRGPSMTASDPVTRHQSDAVARVQLELAVGSEPISGYIQDDTGRHEFVGWIDLVDAIANAHETGDAHAHRSGV